MTIEKIWFDEEKGQIFIHVKDCRSGLLYLPVQKGKKYAYWLADMFEMDSKKLPKNETIYRLMDIKNEPPEFTTKCPECLEKTEPEELEMFGGLCETCNEEV